MAYSPIFFRQITEAFFVRTEPDSNMVKPAAIHMTSAPQSRNENVFQMNLNSPLGSSLICHLHHRRLRVDSIGVQTNTVGYVSRPHTL